MLHDLPGLEPIPAASSPLPIRLLLIILIVAGGICEGLAIRARLRAALADAETKRIEKLAERYVELLRKEKAHAANALP